jgi:hypothetical protein
VTRPLIHWAAAFDARGVPTAACTGKPLNLQRGDAWTLRPAAVTCAECRAARRKPQEGA